MNTNKRKLTLICAVHYVKLCYRSLLFLITIVMYVIGRIRQSEELFGGSKTISGFSVPSGWCLPWKWPAASFHMAGAVTDTAERGMAAAEILRAEFGAYINPQPNGRCLDIPPAGISKGLAVARYVEMMGFPAEDVWTAGDSHNDLTMLRAFHGCAMASGVQAAKDAAEYVCRDLAEVVARILEQ